MINYVRNNQYVSMVEYVFFRLTHWARSKASIVVETKTPTMVIVTRKPLAADSPQAIIASRVTDLGGELWFYVEPGACFFYTLPYDETRDVFEHYKDVYAKPDSATFVGETDAA